MLEGLHRVLQLLALFGALFPSSQDKLICYGSIPPLVNRMDNFFWYYTSKDYYSDIITPLSLSFHIFSILRGLYIFFPLRHKENLPKTLINKNLKYQHLTPVFQQHSRHPVLTQIRFIIVAIIIPTPYTTSISSL